MVSDVPAPLLDLVQLFGFAGLLIYAEIVMAALVLGLS